VPERRRAVKQAVPELGVLCRRGPRPFTSHGHRALIRDGYVAHTVGPRSGQEALAQRGGGLRRDLALDMRDGPGRAIRDALDQAATSAC